MRTFGQGTAPGVYHGIIRQARLQGGVLWAKVEIPSWSTPTGAYVTNWARVAIPWGTKDFGFWGSLHEGEHVLVAFEEGDPERPWVVGFIPMPQGEDNQVEAPPEWLNDDYSDKTPNTNSPPGRENPAKSGPPMNPAVILKSPQWKQYFLLHDKLKKIVFRVASEGDHSWKANPTGEKPEILLGELATHNVLLGDLFMELYNNHRHTDVAQGNEESGPPRDEDKIDPEIHLSHVVYVVRDPTDQGPPSLAQILEDIGRKIFRNAAGGGKGSLGDIAQQVAQIAEEMTKFCSDPAGYVGDLAKRAGVPEPIVDAAKGIVKNFLGPFFKTVKDLAKSTVGVDIPDVEDVCGLVNKLKEGDILGAAGDIIKKGATTALAAVGIPPSVTEGALNLAGGLMEKGVNLEGVFSGVAGKYGAEGLASLAGAMVTAFG